MNISVISDQALQAEIEVEQPLQNEIGPISSSEAGRHLAILGSCSASRINPSSGQHFYLATRAEIIRLSKKPHADTRLVAKAKAQFIEKKKAYASTLLLNKEMTPIFQVKVFYEVIKAATFNRLMSTSSSEIHLDNISAITTPEYNPYVKEVFCNEYETKDQSLTFSFAVESDDCMGHFTDLPMLPISFLMRRLTTGAEKLLETILNRKFTYFVESGFIVAENLAPAGSEIRCRITLLDSDQNGYYFHCEATDATNRRKVAETWPTFVLT